MRKKKKEISSNIILDDIIYFIAFRKMLSTEKMRTVKDVKIFLSAIALEGVCCDSKCISSLRREVHECIRLFSLAHELYDVAMYLATCLCKGESLLHIALTNNDLSKIDPNEYKEEILYYAFEYAIERNTLIVCDVSKSLIANRCNLTQKTKEEIVRQIQERRDSVGLSELEFVNDAWNNVKEHLSVEI